MESAIRTIVDEVPREHVFDSHFVMNELIKRFSNKYLSFAGGFATDDEKRTLVAHGKIGQEINNLMERLSIKLALHGQKTSIRSQVHAHAGKNASVYRTVRIDPDALSAALMLSPATRRQRRGKWMQKQFLIHKLGEIYLVVDISGVGVKAKTLPYDQFTSWEKLEAHFLKFGTSQESLDKRKAKSKNKVQPTFLSSHGQCSPDSGLLSCPILQRQSRVAYALLFIYALRQHAQHLFCPRILALAGPGFLTVADIKGTVGATREKTPRSANQ